MLPRRSIKRRLPHRSRRKGFNMRIQLLSTLLLSASVAFPATAQVQQQPGQQIVQQCLDQLEQFRLAAMQDGFWIGGWATRWGYGTAAAPPPGAPAPGIPPAGAQTGVPQTGAWGVAGPWAAAGLPAVGILSPRHQMRTLYSATMVFAYRGEEEACQFSLAELQEIYDETMETFRETGLHPGEIVTWRQEQILASQDVTEVPWTMSTDQILGTQVRNARDEHLGDISDLVFDRETGEFAYAIISRGGFLGIGTEEVAVPWEMLQVTPGLNLFVLNVPETVVENAPRVDPDRFQLPQVYEQHRQTVDEYWERHVPT
jgi:sporulation protein YlmC with PRC-barrel domain